MDDPFDDSAPIGVPRLWSVATATLLLAAAAFAAPLISTHPVRLCGLLLLGAAAAEALHGFRRTSRASQYAAWSSAALTVVLAVLLLNAPWLADAALTTFIAAPFLVDAARYAAGAIRLHDDPGAARLDVRQALYGMAGNLTVVAGILLLRQFWLEWTIAIASGVRMLGTTWEMYAEPVFSTDYADDTVVQDIAIESPQLSALAARIEREEQARTAIDRGWVIAFLTVLFAIHVGRMGFDRSALGLLSPFVAVLGDAVVALGLAFLVIIPVRLLVRRATRLPERRLWPFALGTEPLPPTRRLLRGIARLWLESRLRLAIRLRYSRYSLQLALRQGLQTGLPLSAILVATVPIWGMSWYFDTENWAASIWNSWAGARTETWRAAMVRAVTDAGLAGTDAGGFRLYPPGLEAGAPFSFVVIGDPGEGDASQHVLRDQLLRAAGGDDVRFVVISSDVVYPTGAMKDYEARFWLPFKGIRKPIYAIPGNHDWYDALEGFVATFFDPQAARVAMRARIEADGRLTSTTDLTIEEWIAEAARLRREYGVPTGFQRAPFFQIQTDGFALIAVDTGVLRRVDDEQLAWLRAALEASRGKTIMALIGHPFLAGGIDQTEATPDFATLRALLREHGVSIVMAGDTHDLEYYREPRLNAPPIHHFVNGGGGAYLSFGTALAWPQLPATDTWAFYPSREAVREKIRTRTPWWKWPAWFWTERFGAWPFSAEWLSAAFDSNLAPFFQSFVVVHVDPAAGRVTIRPWGVHGPLTWREVDHSRLARPQSAGLDDEVAWNVTMD